MIDPQTSKILLSNEHEEVLLIHHVKDGWDFPGGNREPEDQSPEECALRELKEEAGISIFEIRELGRTEFTGKLRHLFGAKVNGEPKIKLSDEHDQFRWFPREDLDNNIDLRRSMKPKAVLIYDRCALSR